MYGMLTFNWKKYLPFTHVEGEVRDSWRLQDGTTVSLRPVRAEDGLLIQELVRGLSLPSRYHRFFYPLHELPPDMLARFTQADPRGAMTLLAVIRENGREAAIAMAQYVADGYPEHCDFAVVVADRWQRHGIGRRLIQTLVCMARAAGIRRIEGDVLAENEAMRRLMLSMGFTLGRHEDGAYLWKVSKVLEAPEWKCSRLAGLAKRDAVFA
jgi:acetyltransferase